MEKITISEEDKIPAGGFLKPTNPEEILGSSHSILDETTGKRQSDINAELDAKITRIFDGGTPTSVYGGTRNIDGGNIKNETIK